MTASGRAILVVGLGFGDEGKGSVVDALARRHGATSVVRFNGGPQAAHQGGDDALLRLSIDPRCVVVTPIHRALNRIRELARGDARHGSVGLGVGEALLDAERAALPVVRVGDARDPARLGARLRLLWRMKIDLAEQLVDGARGAAIDHAALDRELATLRRSEPIAALASALEHLVHRSGVTLTEELTLDELTAATPDLHNAAHAFQGAFRVGWFDVVAARYALRVVGEVDWLAITNLDRLTGLPGVRVCTAHDPGDGSEILRDLARCEDPAALDDRAALTARLSRFRPVYTELPGWRSASDPAAHAFLRFLETPAALGIPVGMTSWGPRAGDKSHSVETEEHSPR